MINLPATPQIALAQAIAPALELLPGVMDSPEACVLLLAIGAQESGYLTRQQVGGPAHGLWQNESPVQQLLLNNPASAALVQQLCAQRCVDALPMAMYEALLADDVFAAGIARLILWCNPNPLPEIGDVQGAWDYYLDTWRPGRPRPDSWNGNYAAALGAITGEGA